jgi:hypothetical protein
MSPKKRKRKPIRYRQISFKLTEGQKAALDRYCRAYQTTPIRFIKALVNGYVERYRPESPPPSFVTENQLELFEPEE